MEIAYIKYDADSYFYKEALDEISRSVERDLTRLSQGPTIQYTFDFNTDSNQELLYQPRADDLRSEGKLDGWDTRRRFSNLRGLDGFEANPTIDGDYKVTVHHALIFKLSSFVITVSKASIRKIFILSN